MRAAEWSADLMKAVPYIMERYFVNLQVVQGIAERGKTEKIRLDAAELFAKLIELPLAAAKKRAKDDADA